MKKSPVPPIFFLVVLILSPLLANEKQVRVVVDRATIYAEAHTESYRIEYIRKGTTLTVFDTGEPMVDWYYVSYSSQRWKSRVTGFILASQVEDVGAEPKEKIPEKKAPREPEPPKISVEEVTVASSPLPQRPLSALQTYSTEQVPRVFQHIEPDIPEKTETVLEREQWAEEAQPKIEKPQPVPAEEKPIVQQVTVTESVGISSILSSKSYALPKSEWGRDSRPFQSMDTRQETVETIEKPAESVADIGEKIPEKLEDRKPPEEIIIRQESKEKKPEPTVPQITPQIPPRIRKPRPLGEPTLLTLGLGYGPSDGSGIGGFAQFNTKTGFSFHLGAGFYPTTYFYSNYDWAENKLLYSGGIKYYLPFRNHRVRPYLDLQYGGLSVEAIQIVTGIWNYQYITENIQKTLYGPSFLAGLELRLGSIGLNGAIGISYNLTEWEYWERDHFLTADVGVLIYLW